MKLMFTRVNTAEETAEVARLATEIWHEYYVSIITAVVKNKAADIGGKLCRKENFMRITL